jgi:L-ribulose-5-phosphate 3-epimerase
MSIAPLEIGVCSWSLQVKSVPELKAFMDRLGLKAVQIACGDPHHASWDEGEAMPKAALAAGFVMTGTMLGFPGEDYTTPATIEKTGGFGDPSTRKERLARLDWALERTKQRGLADMMLHAGYLPEPGDPSRKSFLDTLADAATRAKNKGITLAFETGQETADLLHQTLKDLACDNLRINFDPANMLLYDKGDPIRAVEILAPYIRSVHVKDAFRPTQAGDWGSEVPLGEGEVGMEKFINALVKAGYRGALCIEREVGDQPGRFADIEKGIAVLKKIKAGISLS